MNKLKKRKKYITSLLYKTANITDAYGKLAFAVIEQAIEDISSKKNGSTEDWEEGNMEMWCQVVELEYGYVLRLLNESLGLLIAKNDL